MATIFEALKITEYLESVLKDSFGPCGLDVMLNSSSGSILITNSGAVILDSLYVGHPLGRVIVDKMKSHNAVTGDGVTSFVIVLTQALREITRHLELKDGTCMLEIKPRSWQTLISLSKAFYKIDIDVVPNNIAPILNNLAMYTDLNLENKDTIKQTLIQIISTALSGKFSIRCQNLFTSLLINLILNTCQLGNILYRCILDILDNFSQLCVEFHGIPVQTSHVIQGFSIPREFATGNKEVMPKSGEEFFMFLVLQCSLDDDELEIDATINIKDAGMLSKALSHKRINTFSILKSLKEQEIQLIISTKGVSDMVLHLCRQFEIAVIQMVPIEIASQICKYAKVQQLCSLDLYELQNIPDNIKGKGLFCQAKTLGVQKFIHFSMKQDINACIIAHQILLCAPTQGLCQQYFIALHSALKNVKMSFSDNRQQLVNLPGCGSVELLLSTEFRKLAKTVQDVDISLACSVLSKSFLQIPRTLHKNSHSCDSRDMNFIGVQQKIESSRIEGTVLGVDGKTGGVIDPCSKGVYEPLTGKMLWISHLLQCLSMILRVERIVGVKCIATNHVEEEKSSSEDDEP